MIGLDSGLFFELEPVIFYSWLEFFSTGNCGTVEAKLGFYCTISSILLYVPCLRKIWFVLPFTEGFVSLPKLEFVPKFSWYGDLLINKFGLGFCI